jgi:threonine dehydrogenase-like Zn-dependent dehydrogenase
MNAIVNTAPGTLEWRDVPTPQPGPGQVRIRTLACGICATDLEMIAGWQRTGFPSIPGHEWSGMVEAAGPGVSPELVGRRCVADNVWGDGGEVGFEHPGGYGEYLLTEAANVRMLPDAADPVASALIEPLAVAVRGLRRLRVAEAAPAGDPAVALVFGDGPLGLILVMLLRRAGATVTLVGGRPARLALGSELGAARTVNYHQAGDQGLAAAFGKERFGLVIEASGSAAAMDASMELAERGGRVLVIGDYADARAGFPWNRILHRELELIGSNASAGAWDEAVRLAVTGGLPLRCLATHVLPAERFAEGVEIVRTDREAIKVVLQWPGRQVPAGTAGSSRTC